MASTADRADPFLAFRFEVRLDDLPVGGFSDCGGLSVETEFFDYPEGGVNDHVQRFPGRSRHPNLVLKRGIVDKLLWDWHADLQRGVVRFRNGAVLVRDASGTRTDMRFEFHGALPMKWTGPELSAGGNAVAVETFELAHNGLDRRI
ncbi:phage tail protein [Actinoplanes sp. CA-015351]|uniref:phage tail protein n=1 Tax=Actinoplanes sp. CA-015351 TaxID=3239897 RepID=UPI003D98F4CF